MGQRKSTGIYRVSRVSHQIIEQLSVVEDVLGTQEAALGISLAGYRNHVYRMVNFCHALAELNDTESEKIAVAGCFHDLGIWTAHTFDYLPPSIELAEKQLAKIGRGDWSEHVTQIIGEHHKLRRCKSDQLTEDFRRADLIDLSLGTVKFGLDASYIRDVKAQVPNSGLHRTLLKVAGRWICRHPLNPIPVAKF